MPSSIFGPGDAPAMNSIDPNPYELGTRFETVVAGQITALRYWRHVNDDDDTDIRTLRLWTDGGTELATVDVTSGVGENGWQEGTLSSPVNANAGDVFVVSYGAQGNYPNTSNYFTTSMTSSDGNLVAPANGGPTPNGIYATAIGTFPSNVFFSASYWTDVVFEESGGRCTEEGDGTSDGSSTATGAGESTAEADGSSDGQGTASGDGGAVVGADGSSDGTSAASGDGEATSSADGASDGTSTGAGEGGATAEADGSAAGGLVHLATVRRHPRVQDHPTALLQPQAKARAPDQMMGSLAGHPPPRVRVRQPRRARARLMAHQALPAMVKPQQRATAVLQGHPLRRVLAAMQPRTSVNPLAHQLQLVRVKQLQLQTAHQMAQEPHPVRVKARQRVRVRLRALPVHPARTQRMASLSILYQQSALTRCRLKVACIRCLQKAE